MDTIKVNNISISGRNYSITVSNTRDEQAVRRAQKTIEELLRELEQHYECKDNQDVLSMCLLKFASEVEKYKLQMEDDEQMVMERIKSIKRNIEEKTKL